MAAFAYKAMDANGKSKSGVLEGDNARQIRQQIREQGLIPLELEQVAEQEKKTQASFSLFKAKISAGELALLTRQMATLIESALPIEEALLAVAEQCEKPRHKNMMMAVRSKVVEGHGFADALSEFPYVFDNLFRAMVAAGEKSGHLDTVLNRLADYTENRERTRNQIIQALVYPLIMMVVAVGVVIMLLVKVVPTIVGQFDQMGQDLPTITNILIAISDGVQNYGVYAAIALAVIIFLIARLLAIPRMRMKYHKKLLRMPFVGRLTRSTNTARFARTLSILTASAVPLLESMRIAGNVLENLHLKEAVKEAASKVKEGSSLRNALEKTKMFPPMMMHMIASGERSGELQQMLARAADNQDREFESTVSISLKIFEPVLIVSMAGVVLFIVLAILMPILALNSLV
ncbi:type II secretion system inner membrane protein GspF [Brumicola nitratireducens]|jgi:general secretion pathway protein F|uniref:General secretion pathway protein F n=1 Tax=Glaciecola nitratireducens (strain JCM 12485 / KCTC 12276 / FR1064) TaxID=1085623 RepID=G4QNE4_GLANF|nr:type II secretion system inner membrane protein GspF [Glaciecola nitratireducens]AEP31563.1 general secretion pathway protein F [Glaciecola nitratireducens FR1064]